MGVMADTDPSDTSEGLFAFHKILICNQSDPLVTVLVCSF